MVHCYFLEMFLWTEVTLVTLFSKLSFLVLHLFRGIKYVFLTAWQIWMKETNLISPPFLQIFESRSVSFYLEDFFSRIFSPLFWSSWLSVGNGFSEGFAVSQCVRAQMPSSACHGVAVAWVLVPWRFWNLNLNTTRRNKRRCPSLWGQMPWFKFSEIFGNSCKIGCVWLWLRRFHQANLRYSTAICLTKSLQTG